MIKIEYTAYKFNQPPLLNMLEYEDFKKQLKSNIDYRIAPKSDIPIDVKLSLLLFAIIIIGGLILSLRLIFPNFPKWLEQIIGFPVGISFLLFILAPVHSLKSYVRFSLKTKKYYSKLKKDLIKSNNYRQFKVIRGK